MVDHVSFDMKANNLVVTEEFLKRRVGDARYSVSAWIRFCRSMLAMGYKVTLYEAKNTYSKYVTVHTVNDVAYKIRFSNHKPITHREANGDCDFFVGVTNFGVTNTEQAIEAIIMWTEAVC